jgi:hypothetical protein
VQLAADALKLLANVKDLAAEVDVSPAQAEHLAAPHAIQHQEDERRVQRIIGGRNEERLVRITEVLAP